MLKMMNKFKTTYLPLVFVFLLIGLQSCNVKRFIPEGEQLYTGADIEFEGDTKVSGFSRVESEVEDVLRPEPNSKILGSRLGLLVHYKSQREKPGFLNRFLNKRIGEKPVYLSDINIEQTEKLILNRLENRGFIYSDVVSEISENEKKKKAEIHYKVTLAEPYLMVNYIIDGDTLAVYDSIRASIDETKLKEGIRFDLNELKQERERIDLSLKQKGYYNFNENFLIFEADTNRYQNRRFDLFLRLKREVPEKSIIPYQIERVNIYPNYQMSDEYSEADVIRLDAKNFYQKEEFFKEKRLLPYILINEGDYFSPENSRNTSRRLTSIGAYKFVNIRYDELDTLATDEKGKLEANIYLTPLDKRSIRAELQAVTKSNNFAGPSLSTTLTNRNLFKGGEILNLTLKGGYEFQIASGSQSGLSSTLLGAEAELIFPRVLFPIAISDDWFKYNIPKTVVNAGVDYLNRSKLYTLNTVSGRFGYVWHANRFITHEFFPVTVNYVNLTNTTAEFEQILEDNPFLRSSFNQQFIAGMTYSFTYNGLVDALKTHQIFVNSTLDLAGNSLSLFTGSGDEPKSFLGLEYAQYAKADLDVRYHLRVGSGQKLVTRVYGGIGLPYGNSDVMPFTKQFFSGGPYSVRAFRIRSLGPGTYTPEDGNTNSFFEQIGNIRLEANLEYRFPIYSFVKGAVFADAGNVWNTKSNNALPGGEFSNEFLDEMGIGAGAGVRIDIQGFVIRFDLAAPLKTPSLPKGERWNFDYKNPILNFAIGYPF
jgi:outer membrane protein insertion porin family